MEITQNLIIRLIQQDMKHQQLVETICRAGFETDTHFLGILNIVAELMGQPQGHVPEAWAETYMDYLGRAQQYPISPLGEPLRCLAEECFSALGGGGVFSA